MVEGMLCVQATRRVPGMAGCCSSSVGKLGGREIGYGSDLDLFFVYVNLGQVRTGVPVSRNLLNLGFHPLRDGEVLNSGFRFRQLFR